MTSGTLTSSYRPRRAFTLVELLIVIGIALVLMGILLPAINRAYNESVRTKMALDLQTIATALEAYRQDHGDIPRPSPSGAAVAYTGRVAGWDGAIILCRALLGPGDAATDGADGMGFRNLPLSVTTSKVQGPYLSPDRFKLVRPNSAAAPTTQAELNNACLADRNGRPVLYYPAIKNVDVTSTNGFVAAVTWPSTTRPMFNSSDNSGAYAVNKLRMLLGDADSDNGAFTGNAKNGRIDGTEQPAFKGEFLLISAGPDETFGPASDTVPLSPSNPCDDVANFSRARW
jgi:prepilin-type N-terminal cleavage/methylation domain-containing protein